MSYLFDGANDRLTGTVTTGVSAPFTIAIKRKVSSFVGADTWLGFSAVAGDQTSSAQMRTAASANQHAALVTSTTDVDSVSTIDVDVGTGWVSFIYVVTSATLRDFYIVSDANTLQATTSRVLDALTAMILGESVTQTADFPGLLAEFSVWDKALDASERQDYYDNIPSSDIAAANLRVYQPLDADNATQSNLGLDATGDLTVSGATFDADHPAMVSGPEITDVDTDESITGTQANVVITGTGFGATQGAGSVQVLDGSLSVTPTIDSWADTSIQFDMSIGTSTGIRYGSRTLRVTTDGLETDDQAITVTAPSGVNYVDLTALADAEDRLTTDPDMESGDQLEWSTVVGGTIDDVTVYPDGSFSFVDGVESFDFRVHDVVTGWGASETVTTEGLVPTITTTTLPNGTTTVEYSASISSDGDVPITYSVVSGSIPAGTTLDTDGGQISGEPTTAEIYSFTIRATNSFGTDDQEYIIRIFAAPKSRCVGLGLYLGLGY